MTLANLLNCSAGSTLTTEDYSFLLKEYSFQNSTERVRGHAESIFFIILRALCCLGDPGSYQKFMQK